MQVKIHNKWISTAVPMGVAPYMSTIEGVGALLSVPHSPMKEHLCLLVCTRALLVSICHGNSRGLLLCKSKYAEVISEAQK